MLTIFEQQALREFAETYIDAVRNAIKNKSIARATKAKGSFSSPVNATGRLAESLREEITEAGLSVYVLDYIDKLIYGQEPGTVGAVTGELLEIEKWMLAKGLDYNPLSVMENINRYGSSIWQQHKGNDSGLLGDIDIDAMMDRLREALGENYANQLLTEIKLAA